MRIIGIEKDTKIMKKIERPDWGKLIYVNWHDKSVSWYEIDWWFKTHIKPLNKAIDEALEVNLIKEENMVHDLNFDVKKTNTHKALLINITPIVKDTAESVLRDILENGILTPNGATEMRAKKVLGES